jgi:FlaA1/EpsC-like NDP-sugar epimerase
MSERSVGRGRLWFGICLLVLGRIVAIVAVASALVRFFAKSEMPSARAAILLSLSVGLLWLSSLAFRDRFVFTQSAMQVLAIAGLASGLSMLANIVFNRPDLMLTRVALASVVLLGIGAAAAYLLRVSQRRKRRVVR